MCYYRKSLYRISIFINCKKVLCFYWIFVEDHFLVCEYHFECWSNPFSTPINLAISLANIRQLFSVKSYFELWYPLLFLANSIISLSPLSVSPIYLVSPGGLYLFMVTLLMVLDLPDDPEAPPAAYSKQYQPSLHYIAIPIWAPIWPI